MTSREVIMALEYLKKEGKKTRKKLYDAARTVAKYVENAVTEIEGQVEEFALPWGYRVIRRHSSGGSFLYLTKYSDGEGYDYIDGGFERGYYLAGDFSCWIPKTQRETLVEFAEDIRDGWLEEVHAYLTKRMMEEKEAIEIIEKAIEQGQDK